MNQSIKRFVALLLAALLLALPLCGCNKAKAPEETPAPVVIATQEPAAAPTNEVITTVAPEEPDGTLNAEALQEIDTALFAEYVTGSGFSLHQYMIDPAAFGIVTTPEMQTLGEFTEEDSKAYAETCAGLLAKLEQIDRGTLNEKEQLSCEILEQYMNAAITDAEYEYFYEPLDRIVGLQVQLPLAFALYEIKTVTDVENYLTLLADVPRYLSQVLAYEEERAARGMFMTESALTEILENCDAIINAGSKLFLVATFGDALEDVEGLQKADRKAYSDRNRAILADAFIPAFQTLRDGLSALSGQCRPPQGAYAFNDAGLAYFAHRLKQEAATDISPEDAVALLEAELQNMLLTMQSIYAENPDVISESGKITSGSTKKDLDFVERVTATLLPALPAHSVTFAEIPEELENQMSAAAYVIPALDGYTENTILVNTASEDTELMLTLAHEGYPGHMYQYIYQRSIDGLGLMQRAISFDGYCEGWAQMAEELVILQQTQYDQNQAMFWFANSMLSNAILPALVSINVNYFAYERDDVRDCLAGYGLAADTYADTYYNLAVNLPYYLLSYAIGYAQLAALLRDMSETLGESYLQQQVLVRYLDYGPAYFNLVRERMDEWADAQIQA